MTKWVKNFKERPIPKFTETLKPKRYLTFFFKSSSTYI